MNIRWGWALLGPTLAFSAGCQAVDHSGLNHPEGSSNTSISSAPPSGSPTKADGLEQIWSLKPEIAFSKPTRVGSTGFGVLALGTSGEVLVSVTPHAKSRRIYQSELLLVEGARQEKLPQVLLAGPARQVTTGTVSERYVVWQESASSSLDQDPWLMFAYDRKTKEAREIARAPDVDGKHPPPVPGYTGPAIVGRHVYWAQVSGLPPHAEVDLFGCEIAECDGGRLVARSVAFPASNGKALYAVRADRFGAGLNGHAAVVKVLRGGDELRTLFALEKMDASTISGLSAGQRFMAWTEVGRRARAVVIANLKGTVLKQIKARRGEAYGFAAAGRDFIVYSNFGGTGGAASYAYSMSRNQVFTLGDASGYYFVVSSATDSFGWQQKASAGGPAAGVGWVVVRAPGN